MQQSSHSNKSPSHGDSGEFSHWFQQDQNSTQEKAILNWQCKSGQKGREAAELQISFCQLLWGPQSLPAEGWSSLGEGDAAEAATSWGSAAAASASVQCRAALDCSPMLSDLVLDTWALWPQARGNCTFILPSPRGHFIPSEQAQGALQTTGTRIWKTVLFVSSVSYLGTSAVQGLGRYTHSSAPM